MRPNSTSDGALLDAFVNEGDEDAFRRLVVRYLNMVSGVAFRRTGSAPLAEEITQNVFIALAKKASRLRGRKVVGGWLHRATTIEASGMMRQEYRRRRAMHAYEESSKRARESEAAEIDLADACPHIDEAIAKLSERERNVLMLRFHAGLRFAEMGAQLGKSEDACRKQVSRALARLETLLGKQRGAGALTATTLATGLPLVLTKASGATLSAQAICQSALAHVGTPSAWSLFANLIMNNIKMKTVIAAAVYLALAGTSFIAGRSDATNAHPQIPPDTAGQLSTRPTPDLLSDESGLSATNSGRAEQSIIREAADLMRRTDDPVSIAKGTIMLGSLELDDLPEGIEFLTSIRETDERLFVRMATVIIGIWAEADGPAAAAWLDTDVSDQSVGILSHKVLASWSKADPAAAYAWYRERIEAGNSRMDMLSAYHLSGNVFRAWMAKDPAAALEQFEEVPVEDESSARGGIAEAVYRSRDPSAMLEAIGNMAESQVRSKLVEAVTKKWGRVEPQAAAEWLDAIQMDDEMAKFRAKMELAEEWTRRGTEQLAEIGEWLLESAPNEQMRTMVERAMERAAETGPDNDIK